MQVLWNFITGNFSSEITIMCMTSQLLNDIKMSRWPLRCCDNVTLTFYWLRWGKTLVDLRGRHGDRCHGQLGELGGCLSWNEHQREPCKYSRHHHSIQARLNNIQNKCFNIHNGCILFCTSRRRCHKLANVMALSGGVEKDIAMCKMQRALQKRMHPILTKYIRYVTRKTKAKSQTFVKLNCMKVIKRSTNL